MIYLDFLDNLPLLVLFPLGPEYVRKLREVRGAESVGMNSRIDGDHSSLLATLLSLTPLLLIIELAYYIRE